MYYLKVVSKSVSPEVKCIINELKNGELEISDVPEEFALDFNIVEVERKLGLRKSNHRGFDVITQMFFVEEDWFHKDLSGNLVSRSKNMTFDSFEKYYVFLDGDIYENACYYGYTFEDEFFKSLNLDINRLKTVKSFETRTIDACSNMIQQKEIDAYNHYESVNKKVVREWIDKFNSVDTYKLFKNICNNYEKTTLKHYLELEFFFFQYAFYHKNSRMHFKILMKYLSEDYYPGGNAVKGLCLIYTPTEVCENYNYLQASDSTNRKRKTEIKKFVCNLENQNIEKDIYYYFDKEIHFYIEETKVYSYENRQGRRCLNKLFGVTVRRAFETFEEFIEYRKGDLRNCNLSGDINLKVDFSKYIIDDTTKLPIRENDNLSYKVNKSFKNNEFLVEQFWYDETNKCVKQQSDKFSYFFDFIAFLKGDLSEADLIFCTGIKNLSNVDGINWDNVKMTSDLCEQFNIPYKLYDCDEKLIGEFPAVEKNEEETALVLQSSREMVSSEKSMLLKSSGNLYFGYYNKIGYISDLHLMHRIINAGCKSKEDIIYTIKKIIDNILAESTGLTLIGGDVSSEFSIFELFVKMLRKSAGLGRENFIFVLGNHELWNFPGLSVDEIVEKYRTVLKKNGMYLLHNDLFYINEYDDIGIIRYDELIQSDNQAILEKLRCTRLVVLGGLGFSGYNEEFNANNGVYLVTVDRNMEIKESKKFEQLYNKLTDVLLKKNTVILTHMPKQDWCNNADYHDNFVYVSGHTHRNAFYDNGIIRVYSDNQIGYRNESLHLKNFLIDMEYDCFSDYDDGIYEITSQEYQDFYRGKNMSMTFNRKINILYMLKKKGYYCFIHKAKTTGSLTMLNGGALKKLDVKDVNYYYDNMDSMVASIETP